MRTIAIVFLAMLLFFSASRAQADIYGGTHYIDSPVTGSLRVYDGTGTDPTATVNFMAGGLIDNPYELYAHDSSLINVYGGSIWVLTGDDNSIANIYGGTIEHALLNRLDSTVNIYGGSMPAAEMFDNSVINIYGSGFNYGYGPVADTTGTITGTLHMGDSLSLDFNRYYSTPSIILYETEIVPVPGAVILGVLGLAVARVKLRKYA